MDEKELKARLTPEIGGMNGPPPVNDVQPVQAGYVGKPDVTITNVLPPVPPPPPPKKE